MEVFFVVVVEVDIEAFCFFLDFGVSGVEGAVMRLESVASIGTYITTN